MRDGITVGRIDGVDADAFALRATVKGDTLGEASQASYHKGRSHERPLQSSFASA
jgi:hypothetical protein